MNFLIQKYKAGLLSDFKNNRFLFITLLVSVCCMIASSFTVDIFTEGDAETYLKAVEVYMSGCMDPFRTPIYPLFLKLIKVIAGEHLFFSAVVFVQCFVFLISVVVFRQVAKSYINNLSIVNWVTFFYAVQPTILIFHRAIYTESLSISFCVFFLWSITRYLQYGKSYDVLSLFIIAFLLYMRPAFICFFPVLFLFWGWIFIKRNKAWRGIVGTTIIAFSMLGYCSVYKSHFGIFATSYVSVLNQYIIEREAGRLNPTHSEFPEIWHKEKKMYPEGSKHYYQEFFAFVDAKKLPEVTEMVNKELNDNKVFYLKRAFTNFWNLRYSFMYNFYFENINMNHIQKIVNIPFAFSLLILFAIMCFIIKSIWSKKTIPLFTALLWCMTVVQIITVFLGAQNDWKRLMLPTVPFLFLLIAKCFMFVRSPKKKISIN